MRSLPSFNNLGKLTELYLQNNRIDGTMLIDFLLNAPKEELLIVDISNNQTKKYMLQIRR